MSATTLLIYGGSGSGKTSQLGKLIEEVFITTGKKSRIYSGDFGGSDTIAPYVELDMVDLIEIGTSDPWIFLNKAVRGFIRDDKGKWVKDEKSNANLGVVAFESAHGIAQLLKNDMSAQAAKGVTIGGDANSSFSIKGDGEDLKIGSVKGFQQYAIPQQQILTSMYESFRLPAQYVVWTAGVDVGTEEASKARVIGPLVIGGALTPLLPKDFNYTFHIEVTPAQAGKAPRHVLHLGSHLDQNAGNTAALGNSRRPLDASEMKAWTVEPADLVKALQIVRLDARQEAKIKIQARLEAAKARAKATLAK